MLMKLALYSELGTKFMEANKNVIFTYAHSNNKSWWAFLPNISYSNNKLQTFE
jgi:hypothetical protein